MTSRKGWLWKASSLLKVLSEGSLNCSANLDRAERIVYWAKLREVLKVKHSKGKEELAGLDICMQIGA